MRARLSAVLAAGLLTAATATLAPSAAAAPSERGVASRSTTAAERQAVSRYWTPQRMASARPGGDRIDAMAKPSSQGKPGGGGSTGGGTATMTDVPPAGTPAEARTVGKVFFTLGRTDYVCSGSSVASANDSLVLTAGHCLHSGKGGSRGFATKFMFVPGYDGTASATSVREPFGRYVYAKLFTTSQWANSGDFTYDVGFATVGTTTSGQLEDAVGGYGLKVGRTPYGTQTTSWGYPAAGKYDGRTLKSCSGATIDDPSYDTQGIVCDLTGGSSGGPWLLTGDYAHYAHSVNSYKYTGGAYANTHMFGPFFTETAKAVYDTAQK